MAPKVASSYMLLSFMLLSLYHFTSCFISYSHILPQEWPNSLDGEGGQESIIFSSCLLWQDFIRVCACVHKTWTLGVRNVGRVSKAVHLKQPPGYECYHPRCMLPSSIMLKCHIEEQASARTHLLDCLLACLFAWFHFPWSLTLAPTEPTPVGQWLRAKFLCSNKTASQHLHSSNKCIFYLWRIQ